MLKVYRVLENAQAITNDLIFKNVVPMEKEECLLYIYIIRGIDLTAKDDDGTVTIFINGCIKSNFLSLLNNLV
jgi:hypothetical protein